jgi:uncharacterized DUF497 family protein
MKPYFEYDEQKNRRNIEKHGLDFAEAQALWDVAHFIIPARMVGQESRSAIIGKLDGRLHIAVFTHRSWTVRLISFHKADVRLQKIYERLIYEEKIKKSQTH